MPKKCAIRPGECTLSVVADTGFSDWESIWNAPENDALRKSRNSPFALLPGDELTVPDVNIKAVERPTMALHQFVMKRLGARLRVRLLQRHSDGTEVPVAGASCHVKIDGVVTDASTDASGWVDVRIGPSAREAELTVNGADDRPPLGWHLFLGTVLPDTEQQGALNRLANLGYQAPGEDPQVYWPFALRAFQEDAGIPVTGELDGATINELARRHAI